MNRDKRTAEVDELGAVIFEVLTQQRILDEWAKASNSRKIHLEEISSSTEKLAELFNWLGIDYKPTKDDLAPKNQNDNGRRKIWFSWNDEAEALLQKLAARQNLIV